MLTRYDAGVRCVVTIDAGKSVDGDSGSWHDEIVFALMEVVESGPGRSQLVPLRSGSFRTTEDPGVITDIIEGELLAVGVPVVSVPPENPVRAGKS